jgi:hypothetical protein
MNSEKNAGNPETESSPRDAESAEIYEEERIPLVIREARRTRALLRPAIWMLFATTLLLSAALAIEAYRMGAHSCR